jgi:hypothetical protein
MQPDIPNLEYKSVPSPTFWDGLTPLASRVTCGLAPPGFLLPPLTKNPGYALTKSATA